MESLFEFFVFIVLEFGSKSLLQNSFLLLLVLKIDGHILRKKSRLLNQLQVGVVLKLAEQVNEGLFVVVVALNRKFVVLNVLLAVEGDGSGLDLALLEIDFVTAQNDGDVGSADTSNISVPVGNVLVSHSRSDIEHNDGSLASDTAQQKKIGINTRVTPFKRLIENNYKLTSNRHAKYRTSLDRQYPTEELKKSQMLFAKSIRLKRTMLNTI